MSLDIAIAHKDYDTRGGGEVFVRRLANHLDCPVWVGRRNQDNEPPDGGLEIREIPLSAGERWAIDRGGVTRAAAYMSAWSKASSVLAQYDVVITSGNEPMWYVAPDEQVHIAYTHSTPRFMYDLFPDRTSAMSTLGAAFNIGKRTLYQHNTPRPDLWIANSDRVARRITRYHHVSTDDVRVVYPPVDVHNYSADLVGTSDFYLHVGRLAGHKRVDDIVEAWQYIDTPLKIAGAGPDRDRLERMAPSHVEFLGFVSEHRKRELMSAAKAHVYAPENEDFGMVPIESMAAGTPVIGVNEGFTKYQVRDGANGILFDRGEQNMIAAIQRFERDGVAWTAAELERFATQFGVDRFREQIDAAIDRGVAAAQVEPQVAFEMGETPAVTDGGDADV